MMIIDILRSIRVLEKTEMHISRMNQKVLSNWPDSLAKLSKCRHALLWIPSFLIRFTVHESLTVDGNTKTEVLGVCRPW